jgi:aryl-alcohol dehydrogenase-like predicted oxidoreductase
MITMIRARQGLGCMGMSSGYGPADREEAIATIRRAIELGVEMIDTADVYGEGHNELLVGEAITGRRDEVLVATKFGLRLDPDDRSRRLICGRPDYVRACCDASLQRLGVDHIDLYYQHRVDLDVPVEETVGAMAELVAAGKVGALGLSEAKSETIRRAQRVHPIGALQSEWSLWSRDIEDDVVPTCRELGIDVVPYSPLGRGMLTGALATLDQLAPTDSRRNNPRFRDENFERNLALVGEVRRLAQLRGCTPGQLALAWLHHQGDDVIPIPGTKRRGYLEENLGARSIELSSADLAGIERVAPRGVAFGDRHADPTFINR